MIVDGCAGPGGWEEGLRLLGHEGDVLGIEWNEQACATARAAGHERLQTDVAAIDPRELGDVEGVIFSPPCPTFSAAGAGAARHLTEILSRCITDMARGARRGDPRVRARDQAYRELLPHFDEEKARHYADMSVLVVEPLRYALELRPAWIALEQVPAVLELWRMIARVLEAEGYSCWTGILEAERYGVPQTRERAVLMASRVKTVHPPRATHQQYVYGEPARHELTLEGEVLPWVSMRDALGWGATGRPYPAIACSSPTGGPDMEKVGGTGARDRLYAEQASGRWVTGPDQAEHPRRLQMVANAQSNASRRFEDEPAPTIKGGHDSGDRRWEPEAIQTGNFTAKSRDLDGRRTKAGSEPYERPVSDPAPTVTGAPQSWVGLNTGRDWKKGGTRDDAQTIATDQPAPALDGQANKMQWVGERPATTVQGDHRIFSPGGHIANDGRDNDRMTGRSQNAIRVSIEEAAVLQGFPAGYPWQGNKTQQFQQVGNAVPPPLAAAILAELLSSD